MPAGGARKGAGRPRKTKRSVGTQTRSRRMKIRKPLALATHNFVENMPTQDLDVKLDSQAGYIFAYKMADIPEFTQYKQIFKLYKINKIVVTFHKDVTGANVYNDNLQAAYQPYQLQNVNVSLLREYEDDTVPLNLEDFRKNSKVQSIVLSNSSPSHTISLTPALQKVTTYEDSLIGTQTVVRPEFKQWIDCDNDLLNHRGLQVFLTAQALSQKGRIRMETKCYFSCRNQD